MTTLAGNGIVTCMDGVGTVTSFNSPYGIAVTTDGSLVVADINGNNIRFISLGGEWCSLGIC